MKVLLPRPHFHGPHDLEWSTEPSAALGLADPCQWLAVVILQDAVLMILAKEQVPPAAPVPARPGAALGRARLTTLGAPLHPVSTDLIRVKERPGDPA